MSTTKEMITRWFHGGTAKGATHMLVVCDTFDHTDYPVYVMPNDDVKKIADDNNGPNMTRLMEIYKMSDDLTDQLEERRCFRV